MIPINAVYLEQLLKRFTLFMRHLKHSGLTVDVHTQLLAQQLYASNDFSDRDNLQHSLRTLICKNVQQWRTFEQLYVDFWSPDKKQRLRSTPANQRNSSPAITGNKAAEPGSKQRHKHTTTAPQNPSLRVGRASICNSVKNIDFDFLDDQQALDKFKLSCSALINALLRQWRKTHKSSAPDILDIRQSIQDNRKHGGSLLQLAWRKKRQILPQITLVIDVSRSMSNYANAMLQFALALVQKLPKTKVYIFNTRLIDISAALKFNRQQKIMAQLKLLNSGWGGGTRIAHSLTQLLRQPQTQKKANSYLLIHSDGLDTDPAPALSEALGALKRHYRQLIWLSPLLRHRHYRVETAALKMAQDKIDYLLPSYDSECLWRLAQVILSKGNTKDNATPPFE